MIPQQTPKRRSMFSGKMLDESFSSDNSTESTIATSCRSSFSSFDSNDAYDSDDNLSLSSQSSSKSSVSFGAITIREYPLVAGDNPSCTRGVPLALGWKHSSEKEVDVDQYEQTRPRRRERNEMILPMDVRHSILEDTGYSLRSIRIIVQDRKKSQQLNDAEDRKSKRSTQAIKNACQNLREKVKANRNFLNLKTNKKSCNHVVKSRDERNKKQHRITLKDIVNKI